MPPLALQTVANHSRFPADHAPQSLPGAPQYSRRDRL
jgi:hypothetical protein